MQICVLGVVVLLDGTLHQELQWEGVGLGDGDEVLAKIIGWFIFHSTFVCKL